MKGQAPKSLPFRISGDTLIAPFRHPYRPRYAPLSPSGADPRADDTVASAPQMVDQYVMPDGQYLTIAGLTRIAN
ncbi:hypothetical protein FHS96_002981 [Sphingomonas zeicaulis]